VKYECPECGGTRIAMEVRTWFNFNEDGPEDFDPEDADYVEPIEGGDAICKNCGHMRPTKSFEVDE